VPRRAVRDRAMSARAGNFHLAFASSCWTRPCVDMLGAARLAGGAHPLLCVAEILVQEGGLSEPLRFSELAHRATQCHTAARGLRRPARRYQFTPEELPFWEPFESVAVDGRAGSLFLWDSRTAHAVRAAQPAPPSARGPYCNLFLP